MSTGKLASPKLINSRSVIGMRNEPASPVALKTLRRTKELEAQAKKTEDDQAGRALKLMDIREVQGKLVKSRLRMPAKS